MLACLLASAALTVAGPGATTAEDAAAVALATRVLDRGATLFDTRDARAMAATYTEDARVELISRTDDGLKVEATTGRPAIEDMYRRAFEGQSSIRSKNTVESARMVGPDILLIQGQFRPTEGSQFYPFTQVRVRQGDNWLMARLQLFVVGP